MERVLELETVTDNLQSEITQYMVRLAQGNLSVEESEQLPVLIHNVNDIERIGDHSQNLAELSRRKFEEKFPFSETAMSEIKTILEEIDAMFVLAEEAFRETDVQKAEELLIREDKVNQLQEEFKQTHIERLNDGHCQMNSGFIFLEFIDNLEKVGDRLSNLAKSVVGKMKWKLHSKNIPSQDPA